MCNAYGEVQGCLRKGQQCYRHLLTRYLIFENVLIVYGIIRTRMYGHYLTQCVLYGVYWQLDTLLPLYITYVLLIVLYTCMLTSFATCLHILGFLLCKQHYSLYVTGSEKTRLSGIFYISRNTSFKYSSHSGSLMPDCMDAKFTL